jgi:hypothetical protein
MALVAVVEAVVVVVTVASSIPKVVVELAVADILL